MTPDELDAFAAEVRAAQAAVDGQGPGTAEWDAWFAIKDRWTRRPHGRAAARGDLVGWQLPGETPFRRQRPLPPVRRGQLPRGPSARLPPHGP